jgi:hypothetical protein
LRGADFADEDFSRAAFAAGAGGCARSALAILAGREALALLVAGLTLALLSAGLTSARLVPGLALAIFAGRAAFAPPVIFATHCTLPLRHAARL